MVVHGEHVKIRVAGPFTPELLGQCLKYFGLLGLKRDPQVIVGDGFKDRATSSPDARSVNIEI